MYCCHSVNIFNTQHAAIGILQSVTNTFSWVEKPNKHTLYFVYTLHNSLLYGSMLNINKVGVQITVRVQNLTSQDFCVEKITT